MAGENYRCPACNQTFPVPRVCAQCGSVNPSNANNCAECGTPFRHKLRIKTPGDYGGVQGHNTQPSIATAPPIVNQAGMSYGGGSKGLAVYPGLNRGAFFGWSFLVGILAFFFSAAAPDAAFLGLLLFSAAQVALAYQRFTNIGVNPWLSLLVLIPIVNVAVNWVLLACQPGYAQTNQLDSTGKLILCILIGVTVVGLLGFMILIAAGEL